jgi:hypothetical protein
VYSSGIPLEPTRRQRRVVAQLKRMADRAATRSNPEKDQHDE